MDDAYQQVNRVVFDVFANSAVEENIEHHQNQQRVQKAPEETEEGALVLDLELGIRYLTQQIQVLFLTSGQAG